MQWVGSFFYGLLVFVLSCFMLSAAIGIAGMGLMVALTQTTADFITETTRQKALAFLQLVEGAIAVVGPWPVAAGFWLLSLILFAGTYDYFHNAMSRRKLKLLALDGTA